jgi:hypothetical protein
LPEKLRDGLGVVAALALGLAGFLVLIGWPTLIPTNIGWLDFADRAMHTLGWMFFREVPWGNPPGLSPDLGLELRNSIGLVDGLPLFAIPAKLFAAWLPQPFQYWGDWLLICFLLQTLFAYLVARQLGAGRLIAIVAAAFVLITPTCSASRCTWPSRATGPSSRRSISTSVATARRSGGGRCS